MEFLRRIGFMKADEMDRQIALVAVRSSWLVVMIALWVWAVYDVATRQTITWSLILLLLGMTVFFSTDLAMRRKLSGGHRE